jgi:hypothetical protein
MKTSSRASVCYRVSFVAAVLCCGTLLPSRASAQIKKKNPTSKIYIADLTGQSEIDSGDRIGDLAKKSVHNAQGTIITTKPESTNAMVFSNGTGGYFDENTCVEIKKFSQDPFTPNRRDMDVEPSISQTNAFVTRGTVALCTSRQVAGSSMIYTTAQGSVNIRGKKIVIEASDGETKISMIEGESSVKGGDLDLGGQTLKEGEQAIIRRTSAGQPSSIQIIKIPSSELPRLEEKVTLAFMAKRTVYFEVRERPANEGDAVAAGDGPGDDSAVSLFDGTEAEGNRVTPVNLTPGNLASNLPTLPVVSTVTELVPVEVVPVAPPATPVSASRLQ